MVSRHEVMTTIITIHQRWGELQRNKSKLLTAPPEAAGTHQKPEKENVLVTKRNSVQW